MERTGNSKRVSPMAMSKPLIFSIVLPFLLLFSAIGNQLQLLSSLRIELHQLDSRVSLLESSIEKSFHELRSKEDAAAQVEKMVFEKEITNVKNMIDSIQKQGSVDAKCQMNIRHSLDGWLEKQEWIPILKNQSLTFISTLKPLFDFLTAKTIEAYHVSKNTLKSLVVKLLTSAVPFMQESYESVKPYVDQIASMTKILIMSLGTLLKKMSIFLVTRLMKGLNDLFHWCLEVAAAA